MKNTNQRGSGDLGIIIIILVVVFFLWLLTGGQSQKSGSNGPRMEPIVDASSKNIPNR